MSFSAGSATTAAPAASKTYQAFAAAGGVTHASAESSSTTDLRVGGLENGTTYDVWVVAYSEAGNPSDASALAAGTPQPVSDFYDLYQSSGGAERGGCSHAGGTGELALVAIAWATRLRARRRTDPRVRSGGAR